MPIALRCWNANTPVPTPDITHDTKLLHAIEAMLKEQFGVNPCVGVFFTSGVLKVGISLHPGYAPAYVSLFVTKNGVVTVSMHGPCGGTLKFDTSEPDSLDRLANEIRQWAVGTMRAIVDNLQGSLATLQDEQCKPTE